MIKNLLSFSLALGIISFSSFGQNSGKINNIKNIPLTKIRKSASPNSPSGLFSQSFSFNGEKCGSGVIHDQLMATDPVYNANQLQIEKDIQKTISDWKSGAKTPPPVYTIPLVFHVIHKGEAVGVGTNISNAQILSAVDALNRDYRRTSADGGIAQGAGPDLEIQFCLATKDPSGNPTTGINRVSGTSVSGYSTSGITSTNETQVKALSKWNNANYCNIWVVSEIENNGADISNPNQWTGGTLAYAYFPGAPSSVDGIVCVNLCVGNDPQQNKGYRLWFATLTNRTLTHEMGHYLNLYHTFEGGSCSESSCTTQGDRCCDTPPHIGNNTNCNTPECSGTQQVENYMDYTDESCQNLFTQDQTTRARAVLTGSRSALNTSANNNCTTCTAATVTISSTNPSCTTNNGSATATATGGTTPYTYLWSNGGTAQTISNLGPGTFTVTVTTTGNCTATQSVTLTTPGAPTSSGSSTNTSSSTACDGTATVTASGGSTPYTYLWSNSATTASISGLCAGTYTVTVTGSNSCSAITTVVVSAPAPAGCDTISNFDIANDTAALYSVSGGWGYLSGHNSYDDRAKADFFTGAAGDTVTGAIMYFGKAYAGSTGSTIDVKIWNGSSGSPGAVLGSVTIPISQLSTTQPVLVPFSPGVALTGNFFCGIQFSANGTPQDTVALLTNTDGQTVPGTAWEMWNDLTWHDDSSSWGVSLAHAIWVIKCTPGSPPNCTGFSASSTSSNPTSCTGNNGTATASATGGSTPFTYLWSNSGTTATISGLGAGTYSVTVTDGNSCTATSSVTLTAPGGPTVTATGTNATSGCNGSAVASASGGSSPYTYLWSNSATTANATGLCAGTYTVTATGSNGCTGTATVTITLSGGGTCDTLFYFDGMYYSPQPSDTAGFQFNPVDNDQKAVDSSLISYGINSGWQVYSEVVSPGDTNRFIGATSYFNPPGQADNWLMFGGVSIPSTGATLSYDYQIASNTYRDGYKVLINTTGANISDFASATVLKNVPDNDPSTDGDTVWTPNTIQITAPFVGQKVYIGFQHNANDQFLIFFDDITIVNCSSSPNCTGFSASATSTNATCGQSNGTALATATGGTSPYTYLWSNNATTASVSGLAAGTYSVTVTSANSCTATQSVTITSSTGTAPTLTMSSTNAACGSNNGTATVTATGGTTPYSYLWSNLATTATISGLGAGTYSVTVTAGNCTSTSSVVITGGGNMTATITSQNSSCPSSCTGLASVAPTGGSTPYTYLWSNGATSASITGLCAGSYSVTITDNSSCSVIKQATISSSSTNIFVSSSTVNATCNNSNGSATMAATGGTTPYTYLWNSTPPQTTATATGLPGGTYDGIVTDASGCKDTVTVSVNNVGGVTANVTNNPTICAGASTTLVASGGSTFLWNTGATTNSISVSPANTTSYSVTVSDTYQCSDTASTTVTVTPIPVTTVVASDDTICAGDSVVLTATGGTSYFWNFTSQTTSSVTVSPTSTTTYNVMAMNGNCVGNPVSIKINVFLPSPNAVASSDVSTTYISQGGTVNFSSTGSTGISYGWDFTGDGIVDATTPNATYSYSSAGTEMVILSVTFGNCTDYDTLYINVQNQPGTGISAVTGQSGIQIFPNPNDGKFYIKGLGFYARSIEIYNVLGEKVFEQHLSLLPESWILPFEFVFPTGVYYINVKSEEKMVTRKITLISE